MGVVLGLGFSLWMAIGAYIKKVHALPRALPHMGCPSMQVRTTTDSDISRNVKHPCSWAMFMMEWTNLICFFETETK